MLRALLALSSLAVLALALEPGTLQPTAPQLLQERVRLTPATIGDAAPTEKEELKKCKKERCTFTPIYKEEPKPKPKTAEEIKKEEAAKPKHVMPELVDGKLVRPEPGTPAAEGIRTFEPQFVDPEAKKVEATEVETPGAPAEPTVTELTHKDIKEKYPLTPELKPDPQEEKQEEKETEAEKEDEKTPDDGNRPKPFEEDFTHAPNMDDATDDPVVDHAVPGNANSLDDEPVTAVADSSDPEAAGIDPTPKEEEDHEKDVEVAKVKEGEEEVAKKVAEEDDKEADKAAASTKDDKDDDSSDDDKDSDDDDKKSLIEELSTVTRGASSSLNRLKARVLKASTR